jgi:hypothetical protein
MPVYIGILLPSFTIYLVLATFWGKRRCLGLPNGVLPKKALGGLVRFKNHVLRQTVKEK